MIKSSKIKRIDLVILTLIAIIIFLAPTIQR